MVRMLELDPRFQEFLFCKVIRINKEGDYPVIWFSRMGNNPAEDNHKWSPDKNAFKHCYHKLKPDTYYIISLSPYPVGNNKRRWVWQQCVEVPTKGIMEGCFALYQQLGIEAALSSPKLLEYKDTQKAAKAKSKKIADLFGGFGGEDDEENT